jgi:hypothetical protein
MSKTIIAPIVTLLALVATNVFHVQIGTEVQDHIADAILTGITLYGVFANHKK